MWLLVLVWFAVIGTGLGAVLRRCAADVKILPIVLLVAGVAFVTRATPPGFYGLEYEDAYVYAAAGQFAGAGGGTASQTVLTVSTCAVGSLIRCERTEQYPEHLIGYPALIQSVVSLLGHEAHTVPMIGAVLGTMAALGVWWASVLLTGSQSAAVAAALMYGSTPALALYGGSAVSETASSAVLAVWCGACLEAGGLRSRESVKWWSIASVAAILAALTRRENLICVPATALCLWYVTFGIASRRTQVIVILGSLGITAALLVVVDRSLASEAGQYGGLSFRLSYLESGGPAVIKALASPAYFSLSGWIAIVGGAVLARRIRSLDRTPSDVFGLGLAAVLVVWALSYGAHVRSIYQVRGIVPEPLDYLRYLTNTGVPLALLTSVAFASLLHRTRLVGAFIVGLLVAAGCVGSIMLRDEFAAAELRERTEPALAALESARELGAEVPVITLEPLVAQLHGPPSSVVIGLPWLEGEVLQRVGGPALYLEQDIYQNHVDLTRYARGLSTLPERRRLIRAGRGWRVWQLR